jgi:DNA-binding NarL/FixJ family response regulator
MSAPVRVLVADDHPVVRDGLRAIIATEPAVELAGEAADGAEALRLAGTLRPAVVLMDLQMPGTDGVAATAAIRSAHPGIQVLVLTTYDTDADINRAIGAGATGYLLKDTTREDLLTAIQAAARGEPVLSPAVTGKVLARMRAPRAETLSAREAQVLRAVSRGLANKQIARELRLSEATVTTHLEHIFAKLGVTDRTAAATTALQRGAIRL